MGKKAAGAHAGLYMVVRQRSTECHKKQGCFLCSLPGDLEVQEKTHSRTVRTGEAQRAGG